MDDLTTWLRAQLDEDERVARGTIHPGYSGVWEFDESIDYVEDGIPVSHWEIRFDEVAPNLDDQNTFMGPSAMRHIARHDPARVVREVEAKRSLIAEAIGPYLGIDTPMGRNAELALRLLALPYADRAGYREEWRPAADRPTDT